MFLLYIHANAVLNTRKKLQGDASGAGAGDDGSGLYIHTRRDLYAISHIQVCSAHFPMLALPPPATHTRTHTFFDQAQNAHMHAQHKSACMQDIDTHTHAHNITHSLTSTSRIHAQIHMHTT